MRTAWMDITFPTNQFIIPTLYPKEATQTKQIAQKLFYCWVIGCPSLLELLDSSKASQLETEITRA